MEMILDGVLLGKLRECSFLKWPLWSFIWGRKNLFGISVQLQCSISALRDKIRRQS